MNKSQCNIVSILKPFITNGQKMPDFLLQNKPIITIPPH